LTEGPGAHTCRHSTVRQRAVVSTCLALVAVACNEIDRRHTGHPGVLLRLGVAQVVTTSPVSGIRQLAQNLVLEGLVRPDIDGRMQPLLAETWRTSQDSRITTIKLRPKVRFHDGSRLDARTVAALLPDIMRSFMGPLFREVEHVKATGDDLVEIGFHQASLFLTEALEVQLHNAGQELDGTGPFVAVPVQPGATTRIQRNNDYYLDQPEITAVDVRSFGSVRTAWAELLRGNLDVLYEVGPEAAELMKQTRTISLFTFTRPYQHVILLNPRVPSLRSAKIRSALNVAIDRKALVKSALNEYGVPSVGPVWPQHWALGTNLPRFEFEPDQAVRVLRERTVPPVHFTCLVSPDPLDERIALEVKRQLAAVGVDMNLDQQTRDEILRRAATLQYEGVLGEAISGPTLFRSYLAWDSNGPLNWGHVGSQAIDSAFNQLVRASSDDNYREAISELHRSFLNDPPAIFLAWSVRARAVSRRFAVPPAEPGRDILSTLRLWKPVEQTQATRN
jgi:peptide/nickel transport system substrate-binding protein